MGRVRDAGNKSYGSVRIADFANLLDGQIITIGEKIFEWDDDAAVDPGNILVEIGVDDAECITNLIDQINAEYPTTLLAYVDPVDPKTLRIEAKEPGGLGNLVFTTDMADGDNIIAAVGGELAAGAGDENRARASGTYVVTALDVLAENLMIPTPFSAPFLGNLRVVSSADVPKYITDKPTISSTRIKISKNGATNLATGDKVTWEVYSAE